MSEAPSDETDEQESTDTGRGETADDTPEPEDGSGEEGLGTESGAAGGGNSPENNPDPSTKGATKGTEGAL